MRFAWLMIVWGIYGEVSPAGIVGFIDRSSGNVFVAPFRGEYVRERDRVRGECESKAARAEDCMLMMSSGAESEPLCVVGRWFIAPTGTWDGWIACAHDADDAKETLERIAAGRKLRIGPQIKKDLTPRALP